MEPRHDQNLVQEERYLPREEGYSMVMVFPVPMALHPPVVFPVPSVYIRQEAYSALTEFLEKTDLRVNSCFPLFEDQRAAVYSGCPGHWSIPTECYHTLVLTSH